MSNALGTHLHDSDCTATCALASYPRLAAASPAGNATFADSATDHRICAVLISIALVAGSRCAFGSCLAVRPHSSTFRKPYRTNCPSASLTSHARIPAPGMQGPRKPFPGKGRARKSSRSFGFRFEPFACPAPGCGLRATRRPKGRPGNEGGLRYGKHHDESRS